MVDSGYKVACIFKYYAQFKNDKIKCPLGLRQIQAKTFYREYKKIFDKAYQLFSKYNINITNYIIFFINIEHKTRFQLQTEFLTSQMINKYIDYISSREKYQKIYNHFTKTINNLAQFAIDNDFLTTKDVLRYLIQSKKLAHYYIAGIISKYYLAAIPSMKQIILKLDTISKDELIDIYNKFEIYNSDITSAYLTFKSQKVNPIKLTDLAIFDLKHKKDMI